MDQSTKFDDSTQRPCVNTTSEGSGPRFFEIGRINVELQRDRSAANFQKSRSRPRRDGNSKSDDSDSPRPGTPGRGDGGEGHSERRSICCLKAHFSLENLDSTSKVDCAPHPQPLSPEYQGEGSQFNVPNLCLRFTIRQSCLRLFDAIPGGHIFRNAHRIRTSPLRVALKSNLDCL